MINREEHRKVLFEIIREIYSSPYAYALGFKGGTMLYFFHNLDRLSVDLDFDLLADPEEAEEIRDFVRNLLKKHGKIKEDQDKRNTIFFLLSYKEHSHGVKVEISKRYPADVGYEFRNFYGIQVQCLRAPDAFASKLVAATDRKRTAGRDFYDIYFFLKNNYELNEKLVEERTGRSIQEYLKYLREFVDKKITNKTVLGGVGELIEENKKNWIRNSFKDELLARLDFWIENSPEQ
jgi:predicted nucleotidyltransferase component of viral defense system